MRLLYVGWTRARDRLVLADRPNQLSKGVVALLKTNDSDGVVEPDGGEVEWAGRRVPVVCREGSPDVVEAVMPSPEPALPQREPREHAPAWRLPSAQEQHGSAGQPTVLGERIAVSGTLEWDDLGNVVHGFLAADQPSQTLQQRRAIASRLLQAWLVAGAITADDVLAMADRLWCWIDQRWPQAERYREWPVAMRAEDGSRWIGVADLVLGLGDRLVLIDHKTFPGSLGQAVEAAEGYWGQLHAYRCMLQAATNKPVVEAYVHFPVLGIAVPLMFDEEDAP
jgi:ATP-dependent exoDNAse (exonuclease V) beta subunit